jgi:hypothetical protein
MPSLAIARERFRDERGIVGSWFVKVAVWFAIIGLVLFDAAAVVVNFIGLDGAAEDITVTLASAVNSGELRTLEELEFRADAMATEAGARLTKIDVDEDGNISLVMKREAKTILVRRISFISKWGKSTGEARSSIGRVRPFG